MQRPHKLVFFGNHGFRLMTIFTWRHHGPWPTEVYKVKDLTNAEAQIIKLYFGDHFGQFMFPHDLMEKFMPDSLKETEILAFPSVP